MNDETAEQRLSRLEKLVERLKSWLYMLWVIAASGALMFALFGARVASNWVGGMLCAALVGGALKYLWEEKHRFWS